MNKMCFTNVKSATWLGPTVILTGIKIIFTEKAEIASATQYRQLPNKLVFTQKTKISWNNDWTSIISLIVDEMVYSVVNMHHLKRTLEDFVPAQNKLRNSADWSLKRYV